MTVSINTLERLKIEYKIYFLKNEYDASQKLLKKILSIVSYFFVVCLARQYAKKYSLLQNEKKYIKFKCLLKFIYKCIWKVQDILSAKNVTVSKLWFIGCIGGLG